MLIPTIRPPARGVLPSSMGFKNAVFVNPGDDLAARYNWLKSSDRNGQMGALSATNRRILILAPGIYTLAATLTLDTSYVDICSLTSLNPQATNVNASISSTNPVILQTANAVILAGFTIRNTHATSGVAFKIATSDNSDSYYAYMHFRKTATPTTSYRTTLSGDNNIKGTWVFCKADNYGFVLGTLANSKEFSPTMWFCEAGSYSFGGDISSCSMGGTYYYCVGGDYCFSGCTNVANPILSTAKFYGCIAGIRSFGMGKECAGSFYNCIGGDKCFGGTTFPPANYGSFTGYARNCIASGASFGSGYSSSKNAGEMVSCKIPAMTDAMYCEGAKIRDCYLQVTGTDKSCLDLNDGNTKVYNSTLIANGTGLSITAGEAQNVLALHCRMNKDKHANVTNLTGDGSLAAGYCVVDSDVA